MGFYKRTVSRIAEQKKKAYLGEVGFSCFSSQTGGCPA
jgi:hypothetical protein